MDIIIEDSIGIQMEKKIIINPFNLLIILIIKAINFLFHHFLVLIADFFLHVQNIQSMHLKILEL